MNVLDYIIIGLIAFFCIKGIFRGTLRELSSLAGIVLGLLIGNHYHHQTANLLRAYIPFEESLLLISFIMIFILVVIIFSLCGVLLHNIFKRLLISWFDRSLGFGFALIKGIIISYLLIVLLTFFMPSKSPLIAKSKVAHLVTFTYQSMFGLISQDLYKTWRERVLKESEKVGRIIYEGKEVIKNIP